MFGKRKKQYRQGDVFIERVDPDTFDKAVQAKNAKPRTNGVLAYGEVTGHSHRVALADRTEVEIPPTEQMELVEVGDELYLRIKGEENVEVRHEEHGSITLEPGDFRVTRQREYTPQGETYVAD